MFFIMVNFHHLVLLNFDTVHDCYVEQFLSSKKTVLPNNIHLPVEYEQLVKVTCAFTREATRINTLKCGYNYEI